jgi:homoserine kinase
MAVTRLPSPDPIDLPDARDGWHHAFAPATVANLGPGYDVLGLALDPALGLGDTCAVRLTDGDRVTITVQGDGGRLSTDPAENCASVAAAAVLAAVGRRTGLEIRLHKGLPLGSGLGSSAASSASAALATNLALGAPLTRRALVDCARAGEAVAAGTPHPDNVAPSLLGGLLLMVERVSEGAPAASAMPALEPKPASMPALEPKPASMPALEPKPASMPALEPKPASMPALEIVRLPAPERLRVAVVIPDLEVRTADARAAIPPRIPVADAVHNLGAIALFVSALHDGDLARLGQATRDRLHQPYRIPLMRGFDEARRAALAAGALGAGLSGSGPAMFALADGDAAARAAGEAFVAAFQSLGIAAYFVCGRVAPSFE